MKPIQMKPTVSSTLSKQALTEAEGLNRAKAHHYHSTTTCYNIIQSLVAVLLTIGLIIIRFF